VVDRYGAIIRKNSEKKEIYIIFSADSFGEGADHILNVLKEKNVKGSFFLTGNFLRNTANKSVIKRIISDGHYIAPHSDAHLLYIPWENREKLLVTKSEFQKDIKANYSELKKAGLKDFDNRYFLAPYEWYNSTIASWSAEMGINLINFTPGTGTNADYTTPDMKNYISSEQLFDRLKRFEANDMPGLNGAFLLIHLGTDPARTDKFYNRLDEIIQYFSDKGYTFNKL
jgi:peptidoglycan/xylan/chitin deacetylase (PgdA/CDA1 family)